MTEPNNDPGLAILNEALDAWKKGQKAATDLTGKMETELNNTKLAKARILAKDGWGPTVVACISKACTHVPQAQSQMLACSDTPHILRL